MQQSTIYDSVFKTTTHDCRRKTESRRIAAYLGEKVRTGDLNEYERNLLASMILKVAEHCLEKYEVIKKGLQEIMGGVLLDYPAKTILNKGRAEGTLDMCIGLLKDGVISLAEATKRLSMTEEELKAKVLKLVLCNKAPTRVGALCHTI